MIKIGQKNSGGRVKLLFPTASNKKTGKLYQVYWDTQLLVYLEKEKQINRLNVLNFYLFVNNQSIWCINDNAPEIINKTIRVFTASGNMEVDEINHQIICKK